MIAKDSISYKPLTHCFPQMLSLPCAFHPFNTICKQRHSKPVDTTSKGLIKSNTKFFFLDMMIKIAVHTMNKTSITLFNT